MALVAVSMEQSVSSPPLVAAGVPLCSPLPQLPPVGLKYWRRHPSSLRRQHPAFPRPSPLPLLGELLRMGRY